MVTIGADMPTEVTLRTLKTALKLKRQVTAVRLYTTTFVRPSAIGSQNFGLLHGKNLLSKCNVITRARSCKLLPVT